MNWGRFSKTFAFWILILLIPVALIQLSGNRTDQSPKVNYTFYRDQLARDNIKAVTIQGGKYIQGEFKGPAIVNNRRSHPPRCVKPPTGGCCWAPR